MSSLAEIKREVEIVPHHIAVMMDGNRRWAQQRGLPPDAGHLEGVVALRRTVEAAAEFGVRALTAWGFSTENWKRTPQEVSRLLFLIGDALDQHRDWMVRDGVRLHVIGNRTRLPADLIHRLEEVERFTAGGEVIDLIVALDYGGRDELCRTMRSIARDVAAGQLDPEAITEDLVAARLDTASWPDPDLIIRPGGEQRLSNFMVWQLGYAEMLSTETLWPDFDREILLHLLIDYQQRQRRYGK